MSEDFQERRKDYPDIIERLVRLETLQHKDLNIAEEWREKFCVKIDKIQAGIDDIKKDFISLDKDTNLLVNNVNNRILAFEPVKRIVYGLVGIVLVGVASALLMLVVKK